MQATAALPDLNDVKLATYEAREAIAATKRLAREDPAVFAQFVHRTQTGDTIRLAPMHIAWHDLLTRNDRYVIWSHAEAGKTTQISVLRVLWELGRNPNLRVLILSSTQALAKKIAAEAAGYIIGSEDLHAVFPDLVPTSRKNETWQPLNGVLTVKRPAVMKDASITIAGVGTQGVLGSRFDLIVLDDVLSSDNTATKDARKGTIEWLDTNVQSRLTAKGRMYIIGNAFHPEDALHHYAATFSRAYGEPRAARYPVMSADGTPRWPEAFSRERIATIRANMLPTSFARQYLCVPTDDADSVFKREWIEKGLERGRGMAPRIGLDRFPPGSVTITGVDLAVSQKDSADLTVFFTILHHANRDIEVLEVKSGRWSGEDIIHNLAQVMGRWGSLAYVENNAAQDYLVQFMKQRISGSRVQGLTTGHQKLHPEYGVQRIATELFQGRWIIPCQGGVPAETQAWIDEMLYYNPKAHTGDRLMAAYLARQGIDKGEIKAETFYMPNRR